MPITEIPARLAAREPNRRDRDCVETPGAADSLGQPAAPAELGTHYVGGGGQQDGRATTVEVMSPAANRSAVAEPASGRSAWAASCAETMLAERRRGGDEHEPQDHGGEHCTDDGAGAGPRPPAAFRRAVRRLFYAAPDGLPHVDVAGERGAEQGQAAR
jgi:hypothetical protein